VKLDLTQKQYKSLVQLIYLGVIQMDVGGDNSQRDAAFEVEDYIYSSHKECDIDDYFIRDKEGVNPSRKMHTDMQKIAGAYDEDAFWSLLVIKLADIEWNTQYNQDDIDNMTDQEKEDIIGDIRRKYYREFNSNGLKNLRIDID